MLSTSSPKSRCYQISCVERPHLAGHLAALPRRAVQGAVGLLFLPRSGPSTASARAGIIRHQLPTGISALRQLAAAATHSRGLGVIPEVGFFTLDRFDSIRIDTAGKDPNR
jgi:hypothetical protein